MSDMMGKTAIVTGGASGIGLGIVEAFLEGGMKVAIADIDADAVKREVDRLSEAGAEVLGVELDVCSKQSWENAANSVVERFGHIDVLCNNAGVAQGRLPSGEPLLVTDLSEGLFRMLMDINVIGVFLGVKVIAPMMIARGQGGAIVNTASMAGFLTPPGLSAYVASKFACVGLSESIRSELAPNDISVSVFCPGGVTSNLSTNTAARRAAQVHDADERQAKLDDRPSKNQVMTALSAGRCVLAGIRANDLYIFSHPEFQDLVQERFAAVLASFDAPAQEGYRDPEAVLTKSRNPAHAQILAG